MDYINKKSILNTQLSSRKNRFLEIVANVYLKKTEISHLHKYSDHLLCTLLKHLFVITFLSLLGYDATSLAYLYVGSFSHSYLQILSSSVKLDEERHCTAVFRPLQRCSIGFKSGLWLGYSRTSRDLSLKPLLCCLRCVLRVIVLLEGEMFKKNVFALSLWGVACRFEDLKKM